MSSRRLDGDYIVCPWHYWRFHCRTGRGEPGCEADQVAAFIIMDGQDNVQGVAGQLMTFFSEVGCQFPQFPYIVHSRGWSAEGMERNVLEVQNSRKLREGAQELVTRAVDMAKLMVAGQLPEHPLARGGRKAHQLEVLRRVHWSQGS